MVQSFFACGFLFFAWKVNIFNIAIIVMVAKVVKHVLMLLCTILKVIVFVELENGN